MAEEWVICTVGWVGAAADSTDGPNPVIYIGLTDTANSPSFSDQWFYAADNAKTEMLAVALMARAIGRTVSASLDAPNAVGTPYTQLHRLYMQ